MQRSSEFTRRVLGTAICMLGALGMLPGCSGESGAPAKRPIAPSAVPAPPVNPGTASNPGTAPNPASTSPLPSQVSTPPARPARRAAAPVAILPEPSKEQVEAFEKSLKAISSYSYFYGSLNLNKETKDRWKEVVPLLATMKGGPITSVSVNFEVTDADMPTLAQFQKMESLTLSDCKLLTDAGLKSLLTAPHLKKLTLYTAPLLTKAGLDSLADLPALVELDLTGKKLTGETSFLNKIPQLKSLNLKRCELTDTDLAPIAQMVEMQSLGLYENPKITDRGLAQLGGLRQLTDLGLGETGVTDAGLKMIDGCKELRVLEVSHTAITDAGFIHLAGCLSIHSLNASRCAIKDAGLKYLAGCRQLQWLQFSECPNLTGIGLEHLANTEVSDLNLETTGVTDAGLAKISQLKKVKSLTLPKYGDEYKWSDKTFWADLHPERLTDAGLANLAAMPNLEELTLSGGGITDAGLAHLKGLKKLQKIKLGACPEVTGTGLVHLAGLAELRELNLQQTLVTDEFLKPLEKLKAMRSITFGPGVTPQAVDAYRKAHSQAYVSHTTEYYSPAILARVLGGPLTPDEVKALNAIKELGASIENSNTDKSVTAYSIDKDKEAAFLKQFSLLGKSSLNSVQFNAEVSPELFKIICGLPRLEQLGLENIGKLKDSDFQLLGQCRRLKRLTMGKGTGLTSDSMSCLQNLKSLETVTFEELPVGIKGATALQAKPRLSSVSLRKCGLVDSDIAPLAKVVTLTDLNLSNNPKLTGACMVPFQAHDKLGRLTLSGTGCTDDSLASVGRLPHLTSIDLKETKVTDAGLKHFKSSAELMFLDLPENNFDGSGFVHLAGLKNLYRIVIPSNPRITGEGLQHLAKTDITDLSLDRTGINDAGMARIGELKKLKALTLPTYGYDSPADDGTETLWSDPQPTRLTDAGLKHLIGLTNLERLSVGGGGITDAGLEHIGKLKKLTTLQLSSCPRIDGSGLSQLVNLLDLNSLSIQETLFKPESMKLLPKLPKLGYLSVGPEISTQLAEEYEKSHPNTKISRSDRHYAYSLLSQAAGPALTKSEREALEALKKLNASFSSDRNGEKSLYWYDVEEKNLSEFRKQLQALRNSSLTTVTTSMKLTAADWQWICGLKYLRKLNLSELSEITDTDFAQLSNCGKLTDLGLSRTKKLTSAGMTPLSKLPQLVSLHLNEVRGGDKLTAAAGKLENLQTLTLSNCDLVDADLTPLASASGLRHLNIYENPRLNGSGLKALSGLNKLETLQLSQTKCTDDALANLSGLKSLRVLDLNNTQVTDAGLAHLKTLGTLETLNLPRGRIKGSGLKNLAGGSDLQSISLDGSSEFTGEELHHLAKCSLTHLMLSHTGITDAGMKNIGELKTLTYLNLPVYGSKQTDKEFAFWTDLQAERLTDKGLAELKSLTQLRSLSVSGGGITDAGLEYLVPLAKLQSLSLENCPKIKGPGLAALPKLPALRSLELSQTTLPNDSLKFLEGMKLEYLSLPPTVNDSALSYLKKIVGLQGISHQNTFSKPTVDELKKHFAQLEIEYSQKD